MDLINDKKRIGVCLDTCHLFAAGYDVSTREGYDETMANFHETIGFEFLRGIHLNDSKGKLGCKTDRHENIGKGQIGLDCFRFVMNDKRLQGIPLILETPATVSDEKEIELLYSLIENNEG